MVATYTVRSSGDQAADRSQNCSCGWQEPKNSGDVQSVTVTCRPVSRSITICCRRWPPTEVNVPSASSMRPSWLICWL